MEKEGMSYEYVGEVERGWSILRGFNGPNFTGIESEGAVANWRVVRR